MHCLMVASSKVFVNRETEFTAINNLLLTGDVLVLGEAGIGKTALIDKVIKKIEESDSKKNVFIRINVTTAPYAGWLSQRITLMAYDQIKSDEKRFSKIKNWLLKYYPDLLRFIQIILDMEGKVTGKQIMATNLLGIISHIDESSSHNSFDKAISCLLDQYAKEFGKNVYVVVEDTHELSIVDKKFLVELLANHSSEVHLILSRRTQEKSQSLYSSPEVNYLMRAKRIIYVKGLDTTAVGSLLREFGLSFDLKTLHKITGLSKGNPYILNLLADLAEKNNNKISGKILKPLSEQGILNVWNYVHSQFFENFIEFGPVLRASSILPSDIHAELLGQLLNNTDYQGIQNQLLELERREIFYKDEIGGYRFFHPLFAMYLYALLPSNDRKNMHRIAALYYKGMAEVSPKPLHMVATQYHAEKAGDKELQFWVLHYFAEIFSYVRKIEVSKEYSEKALQLALQLKDGEKEFQCLILQFGLSTNTNIEKLDEKLLRLRYLAAKMKLKERDKINALWAEANYFAGLGDPSKAIKPIKKCREMVKKINDDENYFLLTQYEASLLLDLREKEKARKLLIRCLAEFTKLGNEQGIMFVLGDMGNLEGMSNPKKSLEYLEKCLEIARNRQDLLVIANTLHGMGIANCELRKYNQAEKNFNECIKITKKIGDTKGLMLTYTELARVMLKKGQLKKASLLIRKAQAICKDSKHLAGDAIIELVKGEILEAKGQLDEARQRFLNASNYFNQLGIEDSAKYASYRADQILPSRVKQQIQKFKKIGEDGFTEAERRINPFVGKKVRVVINEAIWINKSTQKTRIIYEGILHKENYSERLTETDRLLGIGKYDWWIEGNILGESKAFIGNYLIQPYLVESISEI